MINRRNVFDFLTAKRSCFGNAVQECHLMEFSFPSWFVLPGHHLTFVKSKQRVFNFCIQIVQKVHVFILDVLNNEFTS